RVQGRRADVAVSVCRKMIGPERVDRDENDGRPPPLRHGRAGPPRAPEREPDEEDQHDTRMRPHDGGFPNAWSSPRARAMSAPYAAGGAVATNRSSATRATRCIPFFPAVRPRLKSAS